jgi:hypothetical protein
MKDLRVGLSFSSSASNPAALGFKVQLGAVPPFQAPLSPLMMASTRDIFSLPP